jgi:hypothetical protein
MISGSFILKKQKTLELIYLIEKRNTKKKIRPNYI